MEIAEREGLSIVHPYDDPAIIAGQGTAALEMLEDAPDLDILVVPIGGGGLISGMALMAKEIKPGIEIVGAEAALYPAMKQALAGKEIKAGGTTIAEGIAVKRPGKITREIIRQHVSDILLVAEPELESAVLMLLEIEKSVVEGAGAATLAAVLQESARFAGRNVRHRRFRRQHRFARAIGHPDARPDTPGPAGPVAHRYPGPAGAFSARYPA